MHIVVSEFSGIASTAAWLARRSLYGIKGGWSGVAWNRSWFSYFSVWSLKFWKKSTFRIVTPEYVADCCTAIQRDSLAKQYEVNRNASKVWIFWRQLTSSIIVQEPEASRESSRAVTPEAKREPPKVRRMSLPHHAVWTQLNCDKVYMQIESNVTCWRSEKTSYKSKKALVLVYG